MHIHYHVQSVGLEVMRIPFDLANRSLTLAEEGRLVDAALMSTSSLSTSRIDRPLGAPSGVERACAAVEAAAADFVRGTVPPILSESNKSLSLVVYAENEECLYVEVVSTC